MLSLNNSKVFLAGNLNFKFRIFSWNIFFEIWRFEKRIALSEKKTPLALGGHFATLCQELNFYEDFFVHY